MTRKKIAAVALLILLMLGLAGFRFLFPDLVPNLSAPNVGDKKNRKPEKLLDLDVFVVNLDERHARRYLRAALSLGFNLEKQKEEIKGSIASVRHTIIMLLSVQNAEDLSNPEGKERLRTELLERVNDAIGKQTVQNIYFKEFLIQ